MQIMRKSRQRGHAASQDISTRIRRFPTFSSGCEADRAYPLIACVAPRPLEQPMILKLASMTESVYTSVPVRISQMGYDACICASMR